MIDSNNTNNTYDKSTLDAKFKELNDKLSDLTKSLSLCVTKTESDKNISDAVVTSLSNLPKYYVTYKELMIYLKDYLTRDTIGDIFEVSKETVVMKQDSELGLDLQDNKLSLRVISPYIAPIASLSINPDNVEYGQDYASTPVTVSVTVDDISKIKSMFITDDKGHFLNEDVTETMSIEDTPSNTEPTTYTLTYINDKDQVKSASCSTKINRRILYGNVKPTAETFSTIANMKAYAGNHILDDKNPVNITITQNEGQYGWIATPYKIKSFTDSSIGFPGGWQANTSDMSLKYTVYNSPYSDGLPYYVYRTSNFGIGTITWNIISE